MSTYITRYWSHEIGHMTRTKEFTWHLCSDQEHISYYTPDTEGSL